MRASIARRLQAQARKHPRPDDLLSARAGHPDRHAHQPHAVPVHPDRHGRAGTRHLGAAPARPPPDDPRSCATSLRTRRTMAFGPTSSVDRQAAMRLGVSMQNVQDVLYDAFGQRQISTIFSQNNQYRVVLEADPSLAIRSQIAAAAARPRHRRRAGAAFRHRPYRARHRAACGDASRAVSVDHAELQSRRPAPRSATR